MMLWTLLLLIVLFLACSCNQANTFNMNMKGSNNNISAVFVFGDSVVDTGNNNLLPTIAKVNYPPYGKDLAASDRRPTGRFSNGLVPADMVVEELGIKELLPAYLDPNLDDEDLLTGVNFASGGAGYDPLTSQLSSVISLPKQIELFQGYQIKLNQITGDEERTKAIVHNGIYITLVGSNDITNTYFGTPFRKPHYDIPSYTDLMVSYAYDFIQDLYGAGARKIAVLGVPPLGCLPSQRTLAGGANRDCVQDYNQMAEIFNSKLSTVIDSLIDKYIDARIIYVDIYNPLLDMIFNPKKHGFKVAKDGCCGTGKIEVTELCNKYTPTCANTSEYIFWDSFHPTERAYSILVTQFMEYIYKII